MATRATQIVSLASMESGQEGDLFLLLSAKQELTTREGKPYFKVTFRAPDAEVAFPIWGDSAWAEDCRRNWTVGAYYKVRASYRETNYGPQLDIRKIREVVEADAVDGFDSSAFRPQSRFDAQAMYDELTAIAREKIDQPELRTLTLELLEGNRALLIELPAATRNHHCYQAGWLEHVLSVTKTAVYLAEKYDDYYSDMQPRLSRSLVVAGAILHDIGKLREIEWQAEGAAYTASGTLVGHIVQGRDIVLASPAARALDPELLLRLEHIIISHQRLPEWGSPKQPMTPEALIVHYADDLDAKYHMMYVALRDDRNPGHLTSRNNQLFQRVYRGPS